MLTVEQQSLRYVRTSLVNLNGSRLLVLHPHGGVGRNRGEFTDLFLHAGNAVGVNCELLA